MAPSGFLLLWSGRFDSEEHALASHKSAGRPTALSDGMACIYVVCFTELWECSNGTSPFYDSKEVSNAARRRGG